MKTLTTKVFDREDCPEWAKYAAVSSNGNGYWFETRCNVLKIPNNIKHRYIAKFFSKNWQNSWIENPKFFKKKNDKSPSYSASDLRSISEEKMNIWIKENTKMINRLLEKCKIAADRGEFEYYFKNKAWMNEVYMKRYFKSLGFKVYFNTCCIKW